MIVVPGMSVSDHPAHLVVVARVVAFDQVGHGLQIPGPDPVQGLEVGSGLQYLLDVVDPVAGRQNPGVSPATASQENSVSVGASGSTTV